MSAPAVVEHLSLHPSLERRGRGTTRHLSFIAHTERVLAERRAWLLQHGEMRPDRRSGETRLHAPHWDTPPGLRTTYPNPGERHSRRHGPGQETR